MARLNDLPASAAESVDALKRRFIRQNREIARVNSNQSIRIRNLEAEISRLLAENISLREQAITATAEAEKWKTSHRLAREVVKMKEKLELKLVEINSLVGELGQLPEKTARRSSIRRRKSGLVHGLIRSPTSNDWRNRQTASGVDRDMQEIKMPAILEDKHYPRRTLDISDLANIAQQTINADSLESPELGPPPIAHLDESDDAMFDDRRSSRRISKDLNEERDEQAVAPAVNTETRRKRRTSSLLQDMSGLTDESHSIETCNTSEQEQANQFIRTSLKPGAKRKLDASELEDTSSRVSKELDDFIFQRKSGVMKPTVKSTRFARPASKQIQEAVAPSDASTSPLKSSQQRKILAPKSTNSPAKRRAGATYEKEVLEKGEKVDKDKPVVSKLKTKPPKISLPAPLQEPELVNADDNNPGNENIQPKTPAAELADLLSPSSVPTEPSTRQRPTQEMAVTNSVEDVLNGSIGRGSRRARAAVSYAEPNLRDKMRRSGKALVGAVEGLSKSTIPEQEGKERSKSFGVTFDLESERDTIDIASAIKGKHEPVGMDVDDEKMLPSMDKVAQRNEEAPSPLRGKKAPPIRVIVNAKHKGNESAEEEELSKAVSRLSVFDPPSSSPIAEEKKVSLVRSDVETKQEQPLSRTRRHSMQAKMSTPAMGQQRPNSAASTRTKDDMGKEKAGMIRRSASVTSLPPANALTSTKIGNTGQNAVPRDPAATAMSRRRSMMI